MNDARLQEIVRQEELPAFRLQQLRQAFFSEHCRDFAQISTLAKDLRERLAQQHPVLSFQVDRLLVSRDRRACKALLRFPDGQTVETVLLNPAVGHWSCCISCQAGCALRCSFCATGQGGFHRQLTAEEISDQVLFWRQYLHAEKLADRLNNVVYMGMGEPLANREAVYASLDELMNPATFALGARKLSVSTAGLAPHIPEFGQRFPQVNLAISLHAANDSLRSALMPINKTYPLAVLRQAISDYQQLTRRKIFIEYVLLAGENDRPAQADELADYLRGVRTPGLVHVNLIGYNPTATTPRAPGPAAARQFQARLEERGIHVTLRQSLGQDIAGACGQLAGQSQIPRKDSSP